MLVSDHASPGNTSAVTVSAWFKTSGRSLFSGIVGKMTSLEPRPGCLISVDDASKLRCDIIGPFGRTMQGQGTVVSAMPIEDRVFHHGACTYDEMTVRLYVDGVLEGTVAYINRVGSSNGQSPGIDRDAALRLDRDLNGLIDEVQIYDSVPSAKHQENSRPGQR